MATKGPATLKSDLTATSNSLQMQAIISATTQVSVQKVVADDQGRRVVYFTVGGTLYLAFESAFDKALT